LVDIGEDAQLSATLLFELSSDDQMYGKSFDVPLWSGKRDYQGRELGEGQSRSATKDEEFHRLVPGAMSRKVFSKCSLF
jgi:hypothetical protein